MREVNGQVFVRLKAGETIKLSLVPVALIESNQVVAHIVHLRTKYDEETLKIEDNISNQEKQIRECNEPLSKMAVRVDADTHAFYLMRDDVDKAVRMNNAPNLSTAKKEQGRDDIKKAKLELESRRDSLLALEKELERLSHQHKSLLESIEVLKQKRNRPSLKDVLVTSKWPVPTAVTSTDADGRFSFPVSLQTNYFLIAVTSREISRNRSARLGRNWPSGQ